jgi:hypothetical protein
MTPTPVFDENLRRLLQSCTPRLTGDDLDRALARFETRGRSAPAPAHARIVAAAAAAGLLAAVLGWLAFSPTPPPLAAPARASAQDVDLLIADLGSASPEAREKAKQRILAIGPAALGPLERALYHQDPEVRVQSQSIARLVRRTADIQAPLAFVRAAVRIVRAHWSARDFSDLNLTVAEAFDPESPAYVHYTPRKSVGNAFDALRPNQESVGLQGKIWPGSADTLTADMIAALDKHDGILFLDPPGTITDLGPICVFTLPDRVGWSAYLVVTLPGAVEGGIGTCQGIAPNEEAKLTFKASTVAPVPGGGLKILEIDPMSAYATILRKGDVLRSVNGAPVTGLQDLQPLSSPTRAAVVLAIDRDEKIFSAQVIVLPQVAFRTPEAELEAKTTFEQAEKLFTSDPDKALERYAEILAKYGATAFLTPARKAHVEERLAELKAKQGHK